MKFFFVLLGKRALVKQKANLGVEAVREQVFSLEHREDGRRKRT